MTSRVGEGRVLIVGAGPGDPDLITLRGAAALGAADVVLYDELASVELLALASRGAECIKVGKRGHQAPMRQQAEISALLIERARAGQTVVRLKGGDPFVFGRGGEEASACAAAGVRFEVVPGVSAAIAAPAYAGIPVTDRRYSASFAVVTGHNDPTEVSKEARWSELASAVDTLVIVMGMRNLDTLLACLIDAGKDPKTPAAAVMDGTLGRQRVLTAPLGELAAGVSEAGMGAPSVVVVGDVVSLRETLGWWEQAPLFGLRVLVTRAREQAGELASALRLRGAEPVVAPMIRLEAPSDGADLDAAIERLAGEDAYDAVVLSSANAVRFLVEHARLRGHDAGSFATRYFCVGPQTARAALDADLAVHLVPRGGGAGDAEAFLAEISSAFPIQGRHFLLPRSEIGGNVLRDGLQAQGGLVDAVVAYRTLLPDFDAGPLNAQIASGAIPILTFTSPSTVRNLVSLLDDQARAGLARAVTAVVGPTTARALRSQGLEPSIESSRPGVGALARAIEEHLVSDPALLEALRERQADALA